MAIEKLTIPSNLEVLNTINELIDEIDSTKLSYYGTCATAASTQAKVVDCAGFELKTGVSIRVKFTNNQSYNGQATLNVNSTGAKGIVTNGTTKAVRYCWLAGEIVSFTYDGTNYVMEDAGIATTSYYGYTKLATSATSTNTDSALTPATINSVVQNMIEPYPVYSTSSTYAVGDRVRYNYQAWECITAITTAEAWTAAHWTALDPIQTQIDEKQATLVSGTNIKTINNTSLLGNGNISIDTIPSQTGQSGKFLTTNGTTASWASINADNIFWATYGTTTYSDIIAAVNANKLVLCLYSDIVFVYRSHTNSSITFYNCFSGGIDLVGVSNSNQWDYSSFTVQEELVSGTNIKTINNTSILGNGNINITPSVATSSTAGIVKPDNNTITVDANGVISSNVLNRNIGEIITSSFPLTDAGLHLLDGALISGSGSYSAFVNYIADLYTTNPTASYFMQTTKVDRYTTVGSPTVDSNGIVTVSSASTKQYILGDTNFTSTSSAWEMGGKFYFTSNSTDTYFWGKGLIGSESNYSVLLGLDSSRKIMFLASTGGNSWNIASTVKSTSVLSLNTWYYIRISFTGTQYLVDVSTDKTTWTNYVTVTSSAVVNSNALPIMIGANPYNTTTSGSMNGQFDLNECYLKVGNNVVWYGIQTITPEEGWQTSVTNYGACDKYVYDSVNNTVRLPKRNSEHGKLIKSYSSGSTYYRIYEDGWCEQGGLTASITGGSSTTTIFNVSFIDTNYSIVTQGNGTYTAAGEANCPITAKTVSSFTIASGFNGSKTFNYIACGYVNISDYQYSPIYEYVVLATSTKTEIEVDIDQIATDLNGKADVDLTNVNNSGTSYGSSWSMPSTTFESLTLGASDTRYISPANGWVMVTQNITNGYLAVATVYTSKGGVCSQQNVSGTGNLNVYIPIQKGETFKVSYGGTLNSNEYNRFIFVYAKGSESEAQ